ncbi:hypothetical protein GCM10010307_81040 [Streptomyces vastus]|uniref:Integrase catalytic domain-containing protein n=1 Tax=Streptomyces vastus TaxID=285451 RepID=A0ABN3RW38_9ACTN
MDVFSRAIVGWSTAISKRAKLVLDALDMALWRRDRAGTPAGQGLVHHSDEGSTRHSRSACTIDASMGSIGDCVDNAMMESFWARVQVELLNRRRWRTRLELSTALFEYLEIFHNRQRRHSALGMLSPVEYELRTPPVA